jgi:hypothetical protein
MKRKKTDGMKGQIEIVVIIALILVSLVAAVLLLQQMVTTPGPSPGIEHEAKTIKDSVNNLIGVGLREVMVKIYDQGGYSGLGGAELVEYGGTGVPVWQACEKLSIPDVEQEIGNGVSQYLRSNLKDEMYFFGKKVKFDFQNAKAEVKILNDKVEVGIYLPTTVEGYEMPLPYAASINSDLRKVLDFSGNFVNDAKSTRFFETITMESIIFSNPDSPDWMPVTGSENECYKYITKRRQELVPAMKNIADYVATHFVWNREPARRAGNPFYPLNTVGGKQYDLDVMMDYPDEWNMDGNLFFSPDPVRINPKPMSIDLGIIDIPLPLTCLDVYGVSYSFRYPLVTAVHDRVMNQWFKFAVMVEVKKNGLGDCEGMLEEPAVKAMCGQDARCRINITAVDEDGAPVPDAQAEFYECDLGKTDENGNLIASVPCGVSEIKLLKEGYKSFGNLTSYHQLDNTTVTMQRMRNVTFHFYGVPMGARFYDSNNPGKFMQYIVIPSVRIKSIDQFNKVVVYLSMKPKQKNIFTKEDPHLLITNIVNTTSMELGNNETTMGVSFNTFEALAIAKNMTSSGEAEMGYLNTTVAIDKETDVYVYVPVVLWFLKFTPMASIDAVKFRADDVVLDGSETSKLMDKLTTCGITPVSPTELTPEDIDSRLSMPGCSIWT